MITKKTSPVKCTFTILLGLFCLLGVCFGYWHIISGWSNPNVIFEYFKQYHDTELGWFKFACVNGGLQWAVGGAAFYFMVVPILLIISMFVNKNIDDWFSSFVAVLVGAICIGVLVSIPGTLFNTCGYIMEEHPIFGVLVGVLAALSLIPAGGGTVVVVCRVL